MKREASARVARQLILAAGADPGLRFVLDGLSQQGFQLMVFDDGNRALEQARARRPALVLAEILLPGLDGLQLCRAIRHDPAIRATPVLLVSVLAAADRAQEAGADLFLSKPLQLEVVLSAILALGCSPAPQAQAGGW